jgi:hypothetical protein
VRLGHLIRGLIAVGFAGALSLVGGSVAGASPPGTPPGTPDQQVPGPPDLGAAVWGPQSLAQVFTAGITGSLTGLVVNVGETGPPPAGDLVVSIESVTGSGLAALPSGTVLGQTTLSPSQVTQGFIDVTFSPGIQSTSGTQYAIVLSDSIDDENGQYLWDGTDTANYQGGSSAFDRGSGWAVEPPTAHGSVDFLFQTYVQSSVAGYIDTPSGGLASASVTFKIPAVNCTVTPDATVSEGVITTSLSTLALAQESCASGTPDYSFTVATPAGSAAGLAGASPGDTVVASMFQSGTSTYADIRDLTSNTHWQEIDATNVGDTGVGIGTYLTGPVASFATTTMKNAQVNGQYLGFQSPVQFKSVSTHPLVTSSALTTNASGTKFTLTFKHST